MTAAALALGLACLLQAAPVRAPLKYRDFDDLARCQFIVQEVCSRLTAGDRKGASAFVVESDARDFRDLPDNLGAIKSCRRVQPAKGKRPAKKASDMTLLLGYESGYTEEVGLRFGSLGDRTCGYISEVIPEPSEIVKDGKVYLRFFFSMRVDGEDGGAQDVSDIVLRVRPEKDDRPYGPSPREVYVGKVIEQIRAERERRQAADDPMNRPLIQKE